MDWVPTIAAHLQKFEGGEAELFEGCILYTFSINRAWGQLLIVETPMSYEFEDKIILIIAACWLDESEEIIVTEYPSLAMMLVNHLHFPDDLIVSLEEEEYLALSFKWELSIAEKINEKEFHEKIQKLRDLWIALADPVKEFSQTGDTSGFLEYFVKTASTN